MAPAIAFQAPESLASSSSSASDAPTTHDLNSLALPAFPNPNLRERQPIAVENWPLQPSSTLSRRDDAPQPVDPKWDPMAHARAPETFNNKGYFALFAILGAVLVVGAIWFFFWADNGGFKFKQGDWDEYKSTVLRRKDKYGNTLSNATPRTNLGQKSVAGTFDYEKRDLEMGETNEKQSHRHHRRKHSHRPQTERGPSDEDVKAYRNERSAKVGGLNRQADGSHYDFTNSDYSYSAYTPSNPDEIISNSSRTHLRPYSTPSPQQSPTKKKGFLERKKEQRTQKQAEKKVDKDQKRVAKAARKDQKKSPGSKSPAHRVTEPTRPRPAQRRPSLSTLDAASTVAGNSRGTNDSSYYANYRPEQPAFTRSHGNRASPPRRSSPRHTRAPAEPRRASPLKREFQPRVPGSYDAYSDVASDTGTKVYQHHIPGVGRSAGTPSRSNGYRRGGGSRRDSLSDSD